MCESTSNSSTPNNNSTRQSERCGCTSWGRDCELDIPIVVTPEQSSPTSIVLKRNKATYIYDVRVNFEIHFVNRTFAKSARFNETLYLYNQRISGGDPSKSINITLPDDSWFTSQHENSTQLGEMGPSKEDIGPWTGQAIISGSGNRAGNLYLDILNENPPQGLLIYSTDLPYEVFLLNLTSCTVINNQSRSGAQENDNRSCSISYPSSVFVIIQDTDQRNTKSNLVTKNNSYQSWLWYVLGGIGMFSSFVNFFFTLVKLTIEIILIHTFYFTLLCFVLFCLGCVLAVAGFMAYRWWVNHKMKEAEVKQADEDIDAVIAEQEQGFGKDLDQVAVNPLAQPFTHLQGPKTNDFNTDEADGDDGGMAEKAEVRTEKIKFKQEFGPTQANKKN
ncbi:hypothetical protein RFI_26961 [Reticulomyxa filosa]|uniref:Uncharacterized protein n=1 Tax=Reticulomyxa filosa TaxID=46433 RepID=X6M973_RETFI|nr:hypothetical protein RFI_26961 [Reticulomyxa filosa]|eukprot:ETO10419.1 hypothetical protein RFI_26961 [Reticulomyxa filosa]